MAPQLSAATRLLRTVRHLRGRQLAHRVRLRALRGLYAVHQSVTDAAFHASAPPAWGWPADVHPFDAELEAVGHPSPAQNLEGVFAFLNEQHDLGRPIDWNPDGASQLWRYHLHYFDWAWDLPAVTDRTWARAGLRRLYESWADANPVGTWDAWSPYVVSLRAWTMCAMHAPLVAGAEWEEAYVDDLARHARYLRANVEFDVGGNHLVKNLKGLFGLGVFLRDDTLVRFSLRHLRRQVGVQVLPDGGHFERSPSYHAQVLGDLLDVVGLARAAGLREELVRPIERATDRMREWLASMTLLDGVPPLLNDCLPVDSRQLSALGVKEAPASRTVLLAHSGYALLADPESRWRVVMDVGPPCPPELPAHAHADPLSVVVSLDGQAVLVDTGTSTYGADLARRQYERSTAAHNTVVVDGENATEVYGAFRAGRRHRVTIEDLSDASVAASHDGYRHLKGGPVHARRTALEGGAVLIDDVVHAAGGHETTAYFHLAPGLTPRLTSSSTVEIGPAVVEFESTGELAVRVIKAGDPPFGSVGRGHGVLEPSACVVVDFAGGSTARLRTSLRPPA